MHERVLEYTGGGYALKLTVTVATLEQAMRRLGLIEEVSARHTEEAGGKRPPLKQMTLRLLQLWTLPSLIAGTTKVENTDPEAPRKLRMPLTAKKIMQVPEVLIKEWSDVVFELNPQWVPVAEGGPDDAEGESKEPGAEALSIIASVLGSQTTD